MEKKQLLELRKKAKTKKPEFIRQDYPKIKRLARKWKKPKGLQSKLRRKLKGHRKNVSVGYCAPNNIKGFHKRGLMPILIKNEKQIEKLNPKIHGALLSSLGQKKKLVLIKILMDKGFTILNIKDPQSYLAKTQEKIKKKKEEKEKKKESKKKKKEEREKEAEKKKKEKEGSIEETLSEEEKKEAEKKEKDKTLIQSE